MAKYSVFRRVRGFAASAALVLATLGCSAAGAVGAPTPPPAGGQTEGVTRVELQRLPAPAPGFEIVQTRVEIPVTRESGRHSHPGPEVGYIVHGDVEMVFDDRPAQILHTGDPFLVPPNVVHNARNIGTVKTMMLSTYVIDASKPLVTVK